MGEVDTPSSQGSWAWAAIQGGRPLAPDVAISLRPTQGFTLILNFNNFLAFLHSLAPFVPYPERAGFTCPDSLCPWPSACVFLPENLGFCLNQEVSLSKQACLALTFLWSDTKLRGKKNTSALNVVLPPIYLDASWINKSPRNFCSFTCHLSQQSHVRGPGYKRHSVILYI